MRARRTDANLTPIVKAYRSMGIKVDVTNGRWDLVVQFGGVTDLVECKDGAKSPSRRKLTAAEKKTHGVFMVRIVESLEHVEQHVIALRDKQYRLMKT